jgi:putative transposase
LPHQVTQRGNRRQRTFFADDDYAEYCGLLAESCRSCGTEVLAYCLMPNHMPLILVPADELGFRDALGEAHRRYIYSFVMDEQHLLAAARYVERNPVRARFCAHAQDWCVVERRSPLCRARRWPGRVRAQLDLVPDWDAFIGEGEDESFNERLRGHASTGRPLGSDAFVESLERRLARSLKRKKPGPKTQERDRYTADLFGGGEGN